MAMSMYEHEQTAKSQGFYFAVERVLPTWEQFGHQKYATADAAFEDGDQSVADQRCQGFNVYRVSLVVPFGSQLVAR